VQKADEKNQMAYFMFNKSIEKKYSPKLFSN